MGLICHTSTLEVLWAFTFAPAEASRAILFYSTQKRFESFIATPLKVLCLYILLRAEASRAISFYSAQKRVEPTLLHAEAC